MIRALFLALMLPISAQAAEIYVCTFDQVAANKGWLPESVVISRDEKETLVFDTLIQQFHRRPLAAAVRVSAASDVFDWSYKVRVRRGNSRIPVSFTATVRRPSGQAEFEVSSPELGGVFRTKGRCKVTPRRLE